MKTMKLSQYAKENSVTYRTAWNRAKKGLLNTKQDSLGNILIIIEEDKVITKRTIIYARVSSSDMKDNLERQAERLTNYAINNGYDIIQIIKEIGSGMNDDRKKFQKMLDRDDYDFIIVEHKDRLTRFGFKFLEKLLNKDKKEIIVVNQTPDKTTDLITDLVSIVYSFSARLYGSRKGKNISEKIEEIIK